MNKIVALIDFTDLSQKTIHQASVLSKLSGAEITLIHVAEKESQKAEAESRLAAMAEEVAKNGITCSTLVGVGSFFQTAPQLLLKTVCDLAIVGTHGQKGLFQSLFGSNIWKLVSHLPCSALVLSEKSEVVEAGFSNVLMPIGPHAEFDQKVSQTAKLLSPKGAIHFFAIDKAGVDMTKAMIDRVNQGRASLEQAGFGSDFIQIESQHYSVGFARETLAFAQENKSDLISIFTRVSEENAHFGQIDKEAMLLNEFGIPVFCVK